MRNLKKASAIILAVAMVLTLVSVNVSAADSTQDVYYLLEASPVENGQFTLNLYLADNESGTIANPDGFYLCMTQYELKYDNTVVKVEDGSKRANAYYNSITITTDDAGSGLIKFASLNASGTEFKGKDTPAAVLNCTVLNPDAGSVVFTPQNMKASDENTDLVPDALKHADSLTVSFGGSEPGPTDAPATDTPAPATDTPAPATDTPAPATDTPAPATDTPAPATDTPAPATDTPAPATDVPATDVPATDVPASEAPATQAPATDVPATQPPVSDTEFTIVIDGSNIPADVDKLIVRTDVGGDDSDYYVLTRGEDKNFTATLPKGYTYSVTGIRDKDDNELALDIVNSKLTFDDATDGANIVVVEKQGEDPFAVALNGDVKISAKAGEDVMNLIPEFTITVTTPVEGGEPTTQEVAYKPATAVEDGFDLRLVDDHNIMVIYKGVVADKYIKIERTIDTFGVTVDNPRPGQELPGAMVSVPGHYTAETTWYVVSGDTKTAVQDSAYEVDYRTTYEADIAIKLDHELDKALENAKYYLNGKEATPDENGVIIFTYTTPGKGSTGTGGGGGFSTGGAAGTTPTPAPEASGAPVVAPTSAPAGTQVFEDVPPTYWAYDYIMDLYNAGIINGETPTLFMPENNITRAEFTKIAVSVFGLTATSTTSQFVDVQASDWFAPFVIAATEAGLVNGISDTEFAPNADITREQMATIIGRQMNMTSSNVMTYPDATSISDYAKSYVAGLSENRLLQGDETGNFRPQANAARSEAATLLDRVYVLTRSEEVPEDVPETTEAPEATAAPTAAPANNNNGGFSTGTAATSTPAPTATVEPDASAAPEATATPASK